MPTSASVTIISVCFNSSAVIEHMLESLPKNVAVVLVDNGSKDINTIRTIAKQYGASVLENAENTGFGTACNLGARQAATEFILFLNPDASLKDGALDALIAGARKYTAASAFNPAILSSSGQPYFKRSSALISESVSRRRGWPSEDTVVPVLTGAALFVRRADFDKVGGFDPAIFLYHEDDDLSLRLKQECGPLMFIRDALVCHASGFSSGRNPKIAALKGWHMGRSRVYAARKHGRSCAFSRALISAILQILLPTSLLSRRKLAKQSAFLRGVWSMRSVFESEVK